MIGNEFLKYPPHKNSGLPQAEYNLTRLQMESAQIPYMRKKLPGGILTVKKIFNTEYKATWTPSGGEIHVDYMVQYRDAGGHERVKFFDQNWTERGDFSLGEVGAHITYTSDSVCALMVKSHEVQVTADLICVYDEKQSSTEQRLWFYSISGGILVDETIEVGSIFWIWAKGGSVYVATAGGYSGSLLRVTPVWDKEASQYVLTQTEIDLSWLSGTKGFFCEDGAFYDHSNTISYGGVVLWADVDIWDVDTGTLITNIPGGVIVGDYDYRWNVTPTNYMDTKGGGFCAVGSAFYYKKVSSAVTGSGLLCQTGSDLLTQLTAPIQSICGRNFYNFTTDEEGGGGDNPGTYTRLGLKILGRTARLPFRYEFSVDWRNTALDRTPLCFPPIVEGEDPFIAWEEAGGTVQVSSTLQELYAFLNLSEDTQDISEIKYLPYMERDPLLNELLIKYLDGG